MNRSAGCYGSCHEVGVLKAEPGGQRAGIGAPKGHPPAIGQALRRRDNRAEVGEVSQRLTTTEEVQVCCTEVSLIITHTHTHTHGDISHIESLSLKWSLLPCQFLFCM